MLLQKQFDNLNPIFLFSLTQTLSFNQNTLDVVDMDWSYFWKWTDFLSYVEFILIISALLCVSTYLLIDFEAYVETIGFLAVFIEAMLGTPQLYRNFTNKSTDGMR